MAVSPLYCSACHTKWTEACLQPFDRCPFKGCAGVLHYAAPPQMTKAVRYQRDRSLPLLAAPGGARGVDPTPDRARRRRRARLAG